MGEGLECHTTEQVVGGLLRLLVNPAQDAQSRARQARGISVDKSILQVLGELAI